MILRLLLIIDCGFTAGGGSKLVVDGLLVKVCAAGCFERNSQQVFGSIGLKLVENIVQFAGCVQAIRESTHRCI